MQKSPFTGRPAENLPRHEATLCDDKQLWESKVGDVLPSMGICCPSCIRKHHTQLQQAVALHSSPSTPHRASTKTSACVQVSALEEENEVLRSELSSYEEQRQVMAALLLLFATQVEGGQ